MTTFTTAELERDPAHVLSTAEREGEATIIRVDGVQFDVRLKEAVSNSSRREFPDFLARMRRMGMPAISREQSEAVDRMIAGE